MKFNDIEYYLCPRCGCMQPVDGWHQCEDYKDYVKGGGYGKNIR